MKAGSTIHSFSVSGSMAIAEFEKIKDGVSRKNIDFSKFVRDAVKEKYYAEQLKAAKSKENRENFNTVATLLDILSIYMTDRFMGISITRAFREGKISVEDVAKIRSISLEITKECNESGAMGMYLNKYGRATTTVTQ